MPQDIQYAATLPVDVARGENTGRQVHQSGTRRATSRLGPGTPDVRLVGWTTLAGGCFHAALFAAAALMLAGAAPALKFLDEQHWLAHLCEVPGMALLALGIFGLYRNCRNALGQLGRVGAYVAAGGLAAEAIAGVFVGIAEPTAGINMRDGIWLPLTHTPGLVGILPGSLAFAAALTRARVLPRWATVPVLIAAGLFVVAAFAPIGDAGFMGLPALISLAWAWTGYTLIVRSPARNMMSGNRTAKIG